MKVLLMLLITNFSFTTYLCKYITRVSVTWEIVCNLSTFKDAHAISYNIVNSYPSMYKMNISCFKLSFLESCRVLIRKIFVFCCSYSYLFSLSPTLSTSFSLCRQRQLKHLIRREFKYRSHTHQSPEECSYQ